VLQPLAYALSDAPSCAAANAPQFVGGDGRLDVEQDPLILVRVVGAVADGVDVVAGLNQLVAA